MFRIVATLVLSMSWTPASYAADYPKPVESAWTAKDFMFHTGDVLPELKIHYTTVGSPSGQPVLLLHGTMGSANNFLTPQYAGEMFGKDQPLDASKYFIIIPDAIGAGHTTKPSDGLKTRFPHYNYPDMVEANYRLLTEGLGIQHVRLVSGTSMGGMLTWLWGEMHPRFMDALVPMSSFPTAMAGRNWMTRRMLIETIRRDPEYKDGNYTKQPASFIIADVWFGLTTNGGTKALMRQAPDSASGDRIIEDRLKAPVRGDANDFVYQYEASSDYDPSPSLAKIIAPVLAVNSEDDERNPVELGLLKWSLTKVKYGQYYIIPSSPDTRGHTTVYLAAFWKGQVGEFLVQNLGE